MKTETNIFISMWTRMEWHRYIRIHHQLHFQFKKSVLLSKFFIKIETSSNNIHKK